ncbi:hypothetical protein F5Y03DRAFT_407931 [Xylaria venustula]|nr:hypothetical protein F5Y03DRAFT_407931 [Xylaria venustula]
MAVSVSPHLLPDGSPPPPSSRSKRTAEDAVPCPPPKICCTATPNSPVRSPRSTSPAAIRPPEPLSINSTLQSRERIYIHPLRWVSQHLQLLECQFVRQKARRKSMTRNAGSRAQDEPTRGQQQRQTVELSTEAIIRAADDLLHDFDLPFRFNRKTVAILQTDGTFSSSSSGSATPTLAYLDLKTLESRRNMSIKLSACNRVNPPITRLRQKQQRRLRPANEVEDPYIAAVLIALAQGSKVHLLALPATNARSLYFYTARIPSVFLDRFDRPSQYFPTNPVPISYYRIPLNQPTKMIRAMDCVISAVCKERQ